MLLQQCFFLLFYLFIYFSCPTITCCHVMCFDLNCNWNCQSKGLHMSHIFPFRSQYSGSVWWIRFPFTEWSGGSVRGLQTRPTGQIWSASGKSTSDPASVCRRSLIAPNLMLIHRRHNESVQWMMNRSTSRVSSVNGRSVPLTKYYEHNARSPRMLRS